MAQDHDTAYKEIFSHAEMMRDLLSGFVGGEWLEGVDFATLERVNASYVSGKGEVRHGDIVGAEAQTPLRRSLARWTLRFMRRKMPDRNIPEIEDMVEIDSMLAERMDDWSQEWKQQGRTEGTLQGEMKLLRRVMEHRFGVLPEWAQARLAQAAEADLEHWCMRLFESRTLDEVFAAP